MKKVKELFFKVLDEGETTKDMKWPSLKIGKWLLISMAFLSPLLGCIIGSTFMDVNSKEFIMLSIPLLFNVEICLCWLLYNLWSMSEISRKKMMVCMFIVVAVASLAINMMYIKRKPEVNPDLNLELEYWNRFSTFSDQELLKIFLVYIMDNDTVKTSQALEMPKNTLIRLLDGTSTATRYASSHIRNTIIQSHCYGKEYILGSNRMVLNDSISKYLYQLWERPKYDNDLTEEIREAFWNELDL